LSIIQEIQDICKEQVFKSVFDAYFKMLRNYLIFKFGSVEKAEDMAQNAFVVLWEHCKKVSPDKAKSFLFTTAIRLSINNLKRENLAINFQNNSKQNPINNESPEFLMVEAEFETRLEQTLNLLPEKQRTVFLLNRLENLSYKEIAELEQVSVKAIEKRMQQALQIIRKEIGNI